MPAISFSVFKDKIKSGAKRQTIRSVRKRAIATGDKLYLYWKQQSPKDCKKLGETYCTKAIPVRIEKMKAVLTYPEVGSYEIVHLDKFAEDDGFDNWQQLIEYFEKNYRLPFEGILIQWNSINVTD